MSSEPEHPLLNDPGIAAFIEECVGAIDPGIAKLLISMMDDEWDMPLLDSVERVVTAHSTAEARGRLLSMLMENRDVLFGKMRVELQKIVDRDKAG